jgi:Mg/Co/Ni transporter MgtE
MNEADTVERADLATVAGRSALVGLITGVVIAIPLAAAAGMSVYIATALDVGAGMALIGALIGANIAGTD